MARTTNDKKGNTVILRINAELHERLKAESEREEKSISEYIRGILSSEIKCNTELREIETLKAENCVLQNKLKEIEGRTSSRENEGVPKIMSEDTYNDIDGMCKASGLTFDKFMDYIRRLFNDGKIYVEGIAVKTKGDYDLEYLVDICHRVNVDPQEMINKLANSLVRR